jgi:hypothetical protein
MKRFDSPLSNLRIASPCPADWNAMSGNERRRFCGDCDRNVYNLSGMTKYDAENLLRLSEGRLCVRYFQRSDGTILTADCPVGWERVKRRVSVCAAAVFSVLFTLLGGLLAASFFSRHGDAVRRIALPFTIFEPEPLMGAIDMTPRPKPAPSPDLTPVGEKEARNRGGQPQRPSGPGFAR